MNKNAKKPAGTLPLVRCAGYTRKSTEVGLEQEFNSLDAQREAGEAFVASQRAEGWTCLPDRYDDGGFTGGTMRTGGAPVRNQFGALLKGLLRCVPCGCAMTPSHTTKGDRRYRYYTCVGAQKRGWGSCPSKSIPAAEIEALVVEQIRCIGRDPALLQATLAQAHKQEDERMDELEAERRVLERDLARWHADMQGLSGQLGNDGDRSVVSRLADLQERIDMAVRRLTGMREQVQEVRRQGIDEEEARQALSAFDPGWALLTPLEQARLVSLLVQQVNYDGATGKVAITFHSTGIRALADELSQKQREMSA